ncbi:NAD(P)-dependent oxidoreductase [Candidatus Fermentibacterales bacterium]|nr:NAD(P)-dependent oxidoreductase [Candidatus Fermentibacterales bacterium]
MRVAISGASGFLGRHLTDALLSARTDGAPMELLLMDARPPEPPGAEIACGSVELVRCDLLRPAGEVVRQLRGRRVDVLIHLAGLTRHADESFLVEANMRMTGTLLDAIDAERTIVTSSSAVYGQPAEPERTIGEQYPVSPVTAYGRSCAARERAAVEALPASRLFVLRLFNLAGPGQQPVMLIPTVASKLARMEAGLEPRLLRLGQLDNVRDYVDVRDAARAISLLSTTPGGARIPPVMNVCSGKGVSGHDVVGRLIGMSEVTPEIRASGAYPGSSPVSRIVGDGRLIGRVIGWRPAVALERTLTDVLDYFRAHSA